MKRNFVRIFSALLVLILAFSLVGCSEDAKPETVVYGNLDEHFVAEKIGNVNRESFHTTAGGLYYQENGKYGIITREGRYDTGAIYASCAESEEYFRVSKKQATSYSDYAGLNCIGLVDARGKILVPMNYGRVRILNDRYVAVYKITGPATQDKAVVTLHSWSGNCSADTNDTHYYSATWNIYDMKAQRMVPNLTGNTESTPLVYGNFLRYHDGTQYVDADASGKVITDGRKIFSDGSYAIAGRVGDVYDTDGNKLFSYDLTGFVPYDYEEGYYIASKYEDGGSSYILMNDKGEIVSAEFKDYISIYGNLIRCGDELFNFKGEKIYDGKVSSVMVDVALGDCYQIRNDDYYAILKEDGTVVFDIEDEDNDDYDYYYGDFVACYKKDDENYYYSHKDKDYTINGYVFAPWLVKTPVANGFYNVVDTLSGEVLFEGYSNYDYYNEKKEDGESSAGPTAYYIYAKYNGGADVYLVTGSAHLAAVNQKKADLYNALEKAYKDAGINVTINRENGEIAMDTTVLFGGDSAALTTEGKAFLNKFIAVYTKVAFSDEYNGFISKTMVEGHTAPLANSTYASGLQLSVDRANNVKNYCLSKATGVDVSMLSGGAFEAIGYSNSQPVYNKDGSVNLDASRRVSFRFLVNIIL